MYPFDNSLDVPVVKPIPLCDDIIFKKPHLPAPRVNRKPNNSSAKTSDYSDRHSNNLQKKTTPLSETLEKQDICLNREGEGNTKNCSKESKREQIKCDFPCSCGDTTEKDLREVNSKLDCERLKLKLASEPERPGSILREKHIESPGTLTESPTCEDRKKIESQETCIDSGEIISTAENTDSATNSHNIESCPVSNSESDSELSVKSPTREGENLAMSRQVMPNEPMEPMAEELEPGEITPRPQLVSKSKLQLLNSLVRLDATR